MSAKEGGSPAVTYRDAYRPPDWRIEHVDLDISIGADAVEVASRLRLKRLATTEIPLRLDGRQLELLEVGLPDRPLERSEYELSDKSLTIQGLPDAAELLIRTRLRPATNTSLEGLYAAGSMLCSQCEAHGFSRITYFLDRPDVLSTYRVRIEADSRDYPVLLSNGNRLEHCDLGNGRHSVVWEDPFPKPCYLFALVAGDLACVSDQYRRASGRSVALEFYVEHGHEERCGHALASLKQAMAWDEQTYGLEYDLDTYMVVAVSSFNMGAMENKGLNIFNDRYVLVSPETATDADYAAVTAVIGHEYFHNWTGNRVTCRDWFQLSLKEGLTVFREQQFMQDCVGGSQRIEQVRMLRERQFAEDAGPLAHPVRPDSYIEINNFYTATVYEKGAELVRMLHGMLGQPAFAEALRDYLQTEDGTAATIEDFVAAMQRHTEIELSPFLDWYGQAGTPQLCLEDEYDAEAACYRMHLSQMTAATPGQQAKKPLMIPLNLCLLDGQGSALRDSQVLLTRSQQTLEFADLDTRPVPVLLRGFSAPVQLVYDYSAEQLSSIVLHERDAYVRWEAMQRLYLACLQAGGATAAPGLIDCCKRLLKQETDSALLAELLTPPSASQLLEAAQPPVMPGPLLQQRKALLAQLADGLSDDLRACLLQHADVAGQPYSPAVAADRALRGQALWLLLQSGDERSITLAQEVFQHSVNMNDSLAALRALRDVDCPEREQAMHAFRQRWTDDPLVLDKWFTLQASTEFGAAAARVRQLMQDPAFALRNPNRVRALIGSFALHNPGGFHAADGSGYRLLAEVLPALDRLNPQVSARLAQAFSAWQRFTQAQRLLIQDVLQQLVALPDLSQDLYEILSKILSVTESQ